MTGDPNKVEDMFDKVDPAAMPSAMEQGKLRPVGGTSQSLTPEPLAVPSPAANPAGPRNPLTHLSQIEDWSAQKKSGGKRWMIITVAVVVILAIAAAVYGFFFSGFSFLSTPNTNVDIPSNTSEPTNSVNTNTSGNENANTAPLGNEAIDKDGDGLTDIEEQTFGTNPLSNDSDSDVLTDRDELQVYKTNPLLADTDNDGLGDREEVFVWLTNPNNADSDGDTYQDGAEVASGYDPNGTGKLVPVTTDTNTTP